MSIVSQEGYACVCRSREQFSLTIVLIRACCPETVANLHCYLHKKCMCLPEDLASFSCYGPNATALFTGEAVRPATSQDYACVCERGLQI